jgi:uncharacterized protein YwgA
MKMKRREELIAQILEASDGKIVGRIRFQKMIYLLQQLGFGSNFKFSYHHYGPYSEEATIAIQRAASIDQLISEREVPSSYGGYFSEYMLAKPLNSSHVGELQLSIAKKFTELMKAETSVVLELAATIHWLEKKERISNWQRELELRKPSKASQENVKRAVSLLHELRLQ